MSKKPTPGFAIWLTGLPSSGKTSLAHALEHLLAQRKFRVQVLDSDELRQKFTPRPTFSSGERDWFYDVLVFLAGLLTDHGVNVIIAATGNRRAYRESARLRIARFAEVYLECSVEACRARDSKGLWKQAERGEIIALPGAGASYEPPKSPEVLVDTERLSIEEAAHQILLKLDELSLFSRRK